MKATSALLIAALVTVASGLSGCTSAEAHGSDPSGAPLVTADPVPDGAAVFLRGRQGGARDRVVVDVVARGAVDLHGAAFRITWDPAALAFVSAEGGSAWSKQALAMAKEGLPGQLVVAWTERGEIGIDATRETVLGSLTFELRGQKAATTLAFKAERSQLVDKLGAKVAVTWHGATIAAR